MVFFDLLYYDFDFYFDPFFDLSIKYMRRQAGIRGR